MEKYPKVSTKEKVSVTLIDQLNGIKNNIADTKALSILLEKYFSNSENEVKGTYFYEYGILNETITSNLSNLEEELDELTKNYLDIKK